MLFISWRRCMQKHVDGTIYNVCCVMVVAHKHMSIRKSFLFQFALNTEQTFLSVPFLSL